MTVIYNNIAANVATAVQLPLTGCETVVLFRADNWGTTQVQIESYSQSDVTMKTWIEPPTPTSGNQDLCIACPGNGEAYLFTVITPDPLTTELFVEVLDGCCCETTPVGCAEFPIKLVPCA